jgi:hypothetical protein
MVIINIPLLWFLQCAYSRECTNSPSFTLETSRHLFPASPTAHLLIFENTTSLDAVELPNVSLWLVVLSRTPSACIYSNLWRRFQVIIIMDQETRKRDIEEEREIFASLRTKGSWNRDFWQEFQRLIDWYLED